MLASLATIMKEKTALVTSMVYFALTETQKKNSSLEQKDSTLDCSPKQDDPAEGPGIPENTDNLPFHFVDVSKLKVVVIDKNTIRDASRFKMTK